jgi:tetratricopeptide (TPR) repeat protein
VRAKGLLLVTLAASVPFVQGRIDGRLGPFRSQEEALLLWRGEQVRRLFPGLEALAADLYWLRTVQYFGGQRVYAKGKSFDLLRPLIDITTSLDPRFEIAYRYGAVFLAEPLPMGAGRPQEGIEILEKGVRAQPLSWRLQQDLGFFHYLYLGDATTASRILTEAAEIPGAAYWLKNLAADILSESGDRQNARQMWQQMYEQAEEGAIRANASMRLKILDAMDTADDLTSRVLAYERLRGEKPERLEALGQAGLWNGPLVDQAGIPFAYDRDKGRVSIAQESPLWRSDRALRNP